MEIHGVKIEWLGHSGFVFVNGGGKRIFIDPFNVSDAVVSQGKADIILITHSHYDHCSIKDIERLTKKGTIVIMPADVQSKITRVQEIEMQVIEAGDELEIGHIKIEAIPAYNINKEFHTKKDGWLGYVIKFSKLVVYHSGDTDKIPEMEKLTGYGKQGNEFVALLPVSGKYVMNAEEAADAASLIKPSLAIPMHYGLGVVGSEEDARKFVELCLERGISARVMEKI